MAVPEISTKALVLGKTTLSEADGFYELLTADLGRISVISKGVGYLKSKLRYCLEPFSLIDAVIIPTKSSGFQLINATCEGNLYYQLPLPDQAVIVRLGHLFSRIVPPDEPSEIVHFIVETLFVNDSFVTDNYLVIVAFLLIDLGYLDKRELEIEGSLYDHLNHESISGMQSNLEQKKAAKLKKVIQQSLYNSQL